jgi:hypothetical protein
MRLKLHRFDLTPTIIINPNKIESPQGEHQGTYKHLLATKNPLEHPDVLL